MDKKYFSRRGFIPLEKRFLTGFTLTEWIIVVVIISILAVLAAVYYYQVVSKSEDSEALTNLAAIRKSELAVQARDGFFINASDTADVNDKLLDQVIDEKIFKYRVVNATLDNFVAIAERIHADDHRLRPIAFSMYPDGLVTVAYSGSSGYGGSGGGSGGSSGGSAGGGAGGGLGGIGGGGGGGGGVGGSGTSGGGSSGGSSGGGGGIIPTPVSDTSSPPTITGDIPDAYLEVLKDTVTGDYYYDLIKDKSVNLYFAAMDGAFGMYLPSWWSDFYPSWTQTNNSILIDAPLEGDWSEEAIATILVHEAMHADWAHNTDTWVAHTVDTLGVPESDLSWYTDPVTHEPVLGDSVFQEFHAFEAMVLFWQEVKGAQVNAELDFDLALYLLGEDVLYAEVARRYEGYPPYLKGLSS